MRCKYQRMSEECGAEKVRVQMTYLDTRLGTLVSRNADGDHYVRTTYHVKAQPERKGGWRRERSPENVSIKYTQGYVLHAHLPSQILTTLIGYNMLLSSEMFNDAFVSSRMSSS